MKASKIIFVFFVFILIFSTGCVDQDAKQKEYNKCTTVCASVLDEDFVILKLCMDECKEKFLEEK